MTSDILMRKGDTQMTRDIKKKVSTYLEKKYEQLEVNELLDVATFLDPRFEMKFVEDNDKDSIEERVVSEGTQVALQLSEEGSSRPEGRRLCCQFSPANQSQGWAQHGPCQSTPSPLGPAL